MRLWSPSGKKRLPNLTLAEPGRGEAQITAAEKRGPM